MTLSTQKRLVLTQLLFQIFVWCKRITKIKENMASIKAVKPKEPGDVGPKAPAMKPAPKKAEQKPKEPKKKVTPPHLLLSVCSLILEKKKLSKFFKSWKMTDVNCWFKQGKSGRPAAKKKGAWLCFLQNKKKTFGVVFISCFFTLFFCLCLMYPKKIIVWWIKIKGIIICSVWFFYTKLSKKKKCNDRKSEIEAFIELEYKKW